MKREGVRSVPSFHYFKNGEKVDVVNGANAEAIEAAIKKHAWVTIGAGVLLKGEMNFTTRGDAGVLERRYQRDVGGSLLVVPYDHDLWLLIDYNN